MGMYSGTLLVRLCRRGRYSLALAVHKEHLPFIENALGPTFDLELETTF